MCLSPQLRAFFQHKHVQKCSEDDSFLTFSLANVPIRTSKSAPKTTVFQHFHFQMCLSPQPRAFFQHKHVQKCSEDYSFSTFSLANVPIRTWKSAPKTTVFQHFHWQMCFSPQRRTIIRHRDVQKCSEDYSFLTCSLPNVLFATAAYNFSTSELQKVVPDRQFFNIFTSKCAFHHSGVQFLDIWTSKSPPGPSVF